MSDARTVFPLASAVGEATAGGEPLLLDGMEVLFDRTVGLYSVELEPRAAQAPARAPPPAPAVRAAARNGPSTHGNRILH